MITRRTFLRGATAVSAGGGVGPRSAAAEPPPETKTVRLPQWDARYAPTCLAPTYIAAEFLAQEGFSDVRFVSAQADAGREIAARKVDFAMCFAVDMVFFVDHGAPMTMLAGIHGGCFKVLGRDPIRSIRDLKGKRVALHQSYRYLLSTIVANIGIDPAKDIHWVEDTGRGKSLARFAKGDCDAIIDIPPFIQQAQALNIGQTILDGGVDKPWSQYFCCMLAGLSDFVQKYPVATKRVLRAILKATDLCAADPARVARRLVAEKFTERNDYALAGLQESDYRRWREFEAEDTVRFYALRLHEVGHVKSSPQQLIAKHTDWRFLNELKKELKG